MKRASQTTMDKYLVKTLKKSESNNFFSDYLFYILPSRFGPQRVKIFERQITKFDGLLYTNSKDNPAKVTHLIAEESIDKEVLLEICDVKRFKNAVFLRSAWLTQCFKNNNLVPVKDFIIYDNQKQIDDTDHNNSIHKSSSSADTNIAKAHEISDSDDEDDDDADNIPSTSKNNFSNINISCNSDITASHAEIGDTVDVQISPMKHDADMDKTDIEKFACAHPSNSFPKNFNENITNELEKLASAYESRKDRWRALGYQKAVSAIKNYPKRIETWEEAKSIRGVGIKLADKVQEILESGQLRKVKEVYENEETKTLQLFIGVWGAGATTANNWYSQGFRTLDDLRAKASLTRHQQIGLKYYDEINDRILRSEAEEIEKEVSSAAESVRKGLQIVTCGSYRRGRPSCGDVDILITHPDGGSNKNIFKPLLAVLRDKGFLTEDLTVQENNGNQQKYLGVCKLPGNDRKHRRLDIIVVPYAEFAPALMYFTGSAHFNRSTRLLATKMGMSLSEHGLRTGIVRDVKNSVTGGTLLHTPTEESIFEHLGLKYRPPNERDV